MFVFFSMLIFFCIYSCVFFFFFFFFQAEDGIRDDLETGVQTCALPISSMTGHDVAIPDFCPPLAKWGLKLHSAMDSRFQLVDAPVAGGYATFDSTPLFADGGGKRSEERRVGKEGGSGCVAEGLWEEEGA